MKPKASNPYRMRTGRNGAESNEPNTNPTPIDDNKAIGINNLERNKQLDKTQQKPKLDRNSKIERTLTESKNQGKEGVGEAKPS